MTKNCRYFKLLHPRRRKLYDLLDLVLKRNYCLHFDCFKSDFLFSRKTFWHRVTSVTKVLFSFKEKLQKFARMYVETLTKQWHQVDCRMILFFLLFFLFKVSMILKIEINCAVKLTLRKNIASIGVVTVKEW